MVEILCPHCEEEIGLDDDASGQFVCPYCDGEFEWNVDDFSDEFDDETEVLLGLPGNQFAAILAVLGIVVGLVSVSVFFGGIADYNSCPEEYRETVTFEGEETYSCSPDYDANFGGMLISILSACFVLFPIGSVLIWLAYIYWTPGAVFRGRGDNDEDEQNLMDSIFNGVFNVGVTGIVAGVGLVLLVFGSLGLYLGIPFFFDLFDSSGDSLGAIGIVIVIPVLFIALVLCAFMVFIGCKYLITVVVKNIRK